MATSNAAEQLGRLAELQGRWRGEGRGRWGDSRFGYLEELTFVHGGKPSLGYRQSTTSAEDGRALHAESGYWRVTDDCVEMVIAQAIGIVEICLGGWDDHTLRMRSTALHVTPSAKAVTAVERAYTLDGDFLHCTLLMATDGGAVRPHLEASLQRTGWA